MNTDAQELQSPPSPSTVKDILDLADPSHIAIIAPDGPVLTYGDLKRQVDSLADKLNSIGIGQEDRVAIILPNGVEHIVSFLAVIAAGATAAPLNPAFTKEEFRFCLEDAGARALISSSEKIEALEAILPESMIAIVTGLDDDGQVSFTSSASETGPRMVQPSRHR